MLWLLEKGADLKHIEVKEIGSEYRAVFARHRIDKNSVVLKIPKSCIMTTIAAKDSDIGKQIELSGWTPNHSHTWLALFLVQELHKRSASYWAPYINTLPRQYANVPLFYSASDRAKLTGCFGADMMVFLEKSIEAEYSQVRIAIPSFQCTLREFQWARVVVVTRVFSMPIIEKRISSEGLAPMADMLNHKASASTTWSYSAVEDAFIIVSTKTQLGGTEIFDSYGPKCNTRYLMNYGFTLPENEDSNQACVCVELPEDLSPLQKKLIGMPSSYDDGYSYYNRAIREGWEKKIGTGTHIRFQIQCLKQPPLSPSKSVNPQDCTTALFRFLRVLVATPDDFQIISRRIDDMLKTKDSITHFALQRKYHIFTIIDIRPVSVQNEVRVVRKLLSLMTSRLAEFGSTLEDDKKNLEKVGHFTPAFDILTLRCSEKQVLCDFQLFCETVLHIWTTSGGDVQNAYKLMKNEPRTQTYANVHWEVLLHFPTQT